ncbi:MAG: phosphoribosyltransferase [Thermoplasmata archaeon]
MSHMGAHNWRKIILVDDVVVRGHTFMGAAWRIYEKCPDAKIICFAAVRAISNLQDFTDWLEPVNGKIVMQKSGECRRSP